MSSIKVSPAVKADFDACMAILRPADEAPFKADVRDVISSEGPAYAAQWISNWRSILEEQHEK